METLAQNTLKALSAQQQKSQDQEAVAPFCSCLFIVAIEENTLTIEVLWEIPWVAFLMPCVFTVWLPSGTGWLAGTFCLDLMCSVFLAGELVSIL